MSLQFCWLMFEGDRVLVETSLEDISAPSAAAGKAHYRLVFPVFPRVRF